MIILFVAALILAVTALIDWISLVSSLRKCSKCNTGENVNCIKTRKVYNNSFQQEQKVYMYRCSICGSSWENYEKLSRNVKL